jgi:hypothetical protein
LILSGASALQLINEGFNDFSFFRRCQRKPATIHDCIDGVAIPSVIAKKSVYVDFGSK